MPPKKIIAAARKAEKGTRKITSPRARLRTAASVNSAHIHKALQAQMAQLSRPLSQSGVAYVSVSDIPSVPSPDLSQCSQDPLGEQIQNSKEQLQDSKSDESSHGRSSNKAQESKKVVTETSVDNEDTSSSEDSSDECSSSSETMSQSEEDVADDQPVDQPVAKRIDHPVDQPVAKPIDHPVDQPVAKPIDHPVDQPVAKPIDHPVDQPVANPIDQDENHSEETVVVEKLNDQHEITERSKRTETATGIENGNEDCPKCNYFKEELTRRNLVIRRQRKEIADLNKEKAIRDDHALSLSQELQDLKENRKIPSIGFTSSSVIDITIEEIKAIDSHSASDKMFVANLAIHFFGANRLKQMSVTGKPTPRFKSLVKEDGSLVYPAREKMDPTIFKFICEKLSERVAIRLGPTKLYQISYFANEKKNFVFPMSMYDKRVIATMSMELKSIRLARKIRKKHTFTKNTFGYSQVK